MTNFTYETGDQTYDGGADGDRFNIYGPNDTNSVYTVIANGYGGDDTLVHIDLDPLNIVFNAGVGRDIADVHFGNVASNFTFNMGDGDDLIIIGSETYSGKGNYTISLGSGQDDVVIYDLTAEIIISDFQTGTSGDRFLLADAETGFISYANGFNPFSTGILSLVQDGASVILEIREGGTGSALNQTVEFSNTTLSEFTSFNFGGLDINGGSISGDTYTFTDANTSNASLPSVFASLGDDIINVEVSSMFMNVFGLAGDDIINGNETGNRLSAGEGHDILYGNGGDDTLTSHAEGNDQLFGGDGNDTLRVSPSSPTVPSERYVILAEGGEGNDSLSHINRRAHDVIFNGGAGQDEAKFWSSNVDSTFTIDFGTGDDTLEIGTYFSNSGGEGDYTVTLGDGSDNVILYSVGLSFSSVSSPPPVQVLITDFETGAAGDVITLNFWEHIGNWEEGENPFDVGAARILQRGTDAVLQFEHYEYTSGSYTSSAIDWSDVIVFENVNYLDFTTENFDGLSLENALFDDSIMGTLGNDLLTGGAGDETLLGLAGNDSLSGGAGDDILEGGGGSDVLDGGEGIDTAIYVTSTNRVVINMAANTATSGHATGDTFTSIENITGSNFADTITGNGGDNVISGGNGFDVLSGFSGDDHIIGGDGRDFMTGGAGADIIDGGASGADIARYVGSDAGVAIDLEAGTASGGHAEGDTLIDVEFLFGSSHSDSLTGDANNNWLFGDGGDDTLDGGGGIDKLFGGAGSDTFVFSAGDGFAFVTDWEDDVDSVNLSNYGYASVADALANMSQLGAHVRFFDGENTLLILNADIADMANDIVI